MVQTPIFRGPCMTFQKILIKLRLLASLKISTLLLVLLTLQVLIGTLIQVQYGYYASQKMLFHSWMAHLPVSSSHWIPFIGVPTTGLLALINLIAVMFVRLQRSWKFVGLWILHIGLILLLMAGFSSWWLSKEASLNLGPGHTMSYALQQNQWEVGLRVGDDSGATWFFHSLQDWKPGTIRYFNEHYSSTILEAYVPHGSIGPGGIPLPNHQEKEALLWTPAIQLSSPQISLSADHPIQEVSEREHFVLQQQRLQLPFSITLIEFKRKLYPGTGIAQSYQSEVEIREKGSLRTAIISMNQPLRIGDYTLFQKSFQQDSQTGMEHSILSVMYQPARTLPYGATLLIGLGMLLHMIMQMALHKTQKKSKNILPLLLCILLLQPSILKADTIGHHANKKGTNPWPISFELVTQPLPPAFQQIAIENDGRIKPLETWAKHLLLSLAGKSTLRIPKSPENPQTVSIKALQWATAVLFAPQIMEDVPVFLIENPELRDALSLKGKARDRYSWRTLQPLGARIDSLAQFADMLEASQQTPRDREVLRLATAWQTYQNLEQALIILRSESILPLQPKSQCQDLPTKDLLPKPQRFLDLMQKPYAQMFEHLIHSPSDSLSCPQQEWIQRIDSVFRQAAMWSPALFAIVPYPEQWLSPGSEIQHLHPISSPSLEALYRLDSLRTAWLQQNVSALQQQAQNLMHWQQNQPNGPRRQAIQAEHLYHGLNPFERALFLYFLAFGFSCFSLFRPRHLWRKIATTLTILAWILQVIGMALRIQITLRPPVTNLYETFVFVAFILVSSLLVMQKARQFTMGTLLASLGGAALLLLARRHGVDGDTLPVLVAVLDSNFWLTLHVITITMGYGGIIAAGLVAHWHLWLQRKPDAQNPSRQAFRVEQSLLRFGLLFTFLGTLLGGIWADQSWGRFWGWDPKENGALMIVLWTAAIFHAQAAGWLNPQKFSLAALGGIACVLFAWFGVNLLGVGLHSYGFTQGTFKGLGIWLCAEILYVLWVLQPFRKRKRTE